MGVAGQTKMISTLDNIDHTTFQNNLGERKM